MTAKNSDRTEVTVLRYLSQSENDREWIENNIPKEKVTFEDYIHSNAPNRKGD